jgi:4-hydroxy-tetrahydrodipicolinate synthase
MIFEQGNPAGIKQVFDSLGIADSFVRLPLVQVDALSKRIDQFVKDTAKWS